MKKAQGPWGLRPPGRPDTPSEGRAQDIVDEIDPAEQHPFFNQSLQIDRAIREIQVNRTRLESRAPMLLSSTHEELAAAQTTAAFPQNSYDNDSQAIGPQNRHDNDNQAFNDFRTQAAPAAVTTSYRDSQGRLYQQVPSRYASVQRTPSVYGMPNRSDVAGEAHQGPTTDSRFGLQSRPPPNMQGSAQMPSQATMNRQNHRRNGHRYNRQFDNPGNCNRRQAGRATEHGEPELNNHTQTERRRMAGAKSRVRGNVATRNFPEHDTPEQAAFAADLLSKGHIWEISDDAGDIAFETSRETTFGRGNAQNAQQQQHQQMNENRQQQGFGINHNGHGLLALHYGIGNPHPSFAQPPTARGYDIEEARHATTYPPRTVTLPPPDAELSAAWNRHRNRTEPTSLSLPQRSSNNDNIQSLRPRASEPTTFGGLGGRRLFDTSRASSPGMTGSQRNDLSGQGSFTDPKNESLIQEMGKSREDVSYFGAGPASLPTAVLKTAAEALVNYNGIGLGLAELSHRSPEARDIINQTKADLREYLDVPNDYEILFMQGGGSGQFSATVCNMVGFWVEKRRAKIEAYLGAAKEDHVGNEEFERAVQDAVAKDLKVDYLVTGSWSLKASQEAVHLLGDRYVNIAMNAKKINDGKFGKIPNEDSWTLSENPAMVYYCDNETVDGVEFPSFPKILEPKGEDGDPIVVADMSSNILSRRVPIKNFSVIFFGAQKNLGCTGITVVVIKKSLLQPTSNVSKERCPMPEMMRKLGLPIGPSILDYRTIAKNNSLYNTLSIFDVFVAGQVLKNLLNTFPNKVDGQEAKAKEKADLIYEVLDALPTRYKVIPDKAVRSRMNICFRIISDGDEAEVMDSHRSVRGIRVSNYNSTTFEATERLRDYLSSFPLTDETIQYFGPLKRSANASTDLKYHQLLEMRFKTSVRNIQTFSKLTASLSSLGKVAWVRLDDDGVRFTIIPETGTQVWASLAIDSIFEDYTIQSAAPNNTINLELPLPPLSRALKSALNATAASIRLTKNDGIPVLSLTIITNTINSGTSANGFLNGESADPFGENAFREEISEASVRRDREAVVTQDIPIRVLTADRVEGIHEPRVREPDAHIVLPPLLQLKAISDRFTKLALVAGTGAKNANTPKLELSANMHGCLKLRIVTDALNISSVWTGLDNPELDPRQVAEGEAIEDHPSSKLKAAGPEAWATRREHPIAKRSAIGKFLSEMKRDRHIAWTLVRGRKPRDLLEQEV
ncbi:hypothetical protein B7494_g2408 [Chlorociboria aeruginascens]|nr:hypothetical protein B7494_g2408 [Chlorociboria aeruginascens]